MQKRFLHRGYFKIEALCSNSTGFLSFWVETDRKIVALFTAVESRMYEQIMSVKYTEFVTEFSDDTSTSTINSPQIESFQKLPEFQLFHFPEEHNISRLYQIHCKLLTLYDQRKRRVIPNEGREIAYIYNATLKRVIRQAEIGNYTYESATNRYRLTWLNAFRQTFRFCWPVFPILCKLDKRKSQKLLQKLNVSDQY
ncbi:MAG: hypothetical protein JNN15_06720 [Blastocatellia bacterium]|nr:hypothetical protein [Blastocatellia bacterium]